MCSIAGAKKKAEVERMLDLMRHRSPDGMKVSSGTFVMGMGRLAIVDTSNTEFPMEREGYTLSFNGEIYNYRELREHLVDRGYKFTTQTDTEVLLNAFIEWGDKCLDFLNGMFAFAIRIPNGDVFCARDHAGEKPLYYTRGEFSFASEAKALGFDCFELLHGHKLWYLAASGEVFLDRWFYPMQVEIPETLQEATTMLEILLQDSIRLRTYSDVPYGLYLSDGIDSNLINTFHDFRSFFTYRDANYAEDFNNTIEKIVWHLDYPVSSFSAYGLYKLAEDANKAGVKVVLSGEGADELFGGYVRYIGNEFNRRCAEEFPSYKGLFPYRDVLREEFDGNMQELLRMGDRMASAWGVENRCPYLDRRIIEFAWSLPMEWKVDGMTTKVILRELLARRDKSYQFKEKHGLYCSVNQWIGGDGFKKDKYLALQNEIWKRLASSTLTGHKTKSALV